MLASEHFFLTLYMIFLPFRLATTVIDIVRFDRLLQSHFCRTIQVSQFLLFFTSLDFCAMELSVVLVESFPLDKLQITEYTLKALSKMDDLNMAIEMMLIPKTHYAMITFILFLVCVGNHMSFEM